MTEPALLPHPAPQLEKAFSRVLAERMQGLPFVNAGIRVEAVAFSPWKHYWLGTMLTPWSMNLVLLPREPARWRPLAEGQKRRYLFPAGEFDFISARDEAIGEFLACSLYSPVLQFTDHETARETARLARDALFEPDAEAPPAVDSRLDRPLTRRELLRGRRREEADEPRG